LKFLGEELEDAKTLHHYLVERDSTIELQRTASSGRPTMHIFVRNADLKYVPLPLPPTTLVATVKVQIEANESVPADLQLLVYNERRLEDGKTLADYSVETNSTLYLYLPVAHVPGRTKAGSSAQF
jgi:ubiquitin C